MLPGHIKYLPPNLWPQHDEPYSNYVARNAQWQKEYQDFLMLHWMQRGKPFGVFASHRYEMHFGVSVHGIKTTFDWECAVKEDYYFEYRKRMTRSRTMVESGVTSPEHYDLFLIGDHTVAAVIRRARLLEILEAVEKKDAIGVDHAVRKFPVDGNEMIISEGFTIPRDFVHARLAVATLEFHELSSMEVHIHDEEYRSRLP